MNETNYGISDIAQMTMLSTRTIRTYIKSGLLKGVKKEGAWVFTKDDLGCFLNESHIKQNLRIKADSLVRGFLDNRNKAVASVCSIYDYPVVDLQHSKRICEKIINEINSDQYGTITFSYHFNGRKNIVRIIVIGDPGMVMDMIQACNI